MILVAGSANLDFVVRAPHIPVPGETVMGRDLALFPGGKGANQAVASARAGNAPTHMLLALGADGHAQPLEASLASAGVATHIVRTSEVASGTAFICVSDDGENAITVAPGANAALRPEHLATHGPDLRGFSHLLLQLETPLDSVLAFARAAQAAGVCVVLNAAPAQALSAPLLDAVHWLIVNEAELASVSACHGNVAQCLHQLARPHLNVVVTLGSRGACARVDGSYLLQPAFAVQSVDTTGAGDTFCGALGAQLGAGVSAAAALQFACAAAAIACTRPGAQSAIPSGAEVQDFLQHSAQQDVTEYNLAAQRLRSYCGIPSV